MITLTPFEDEFCQKIHTIYSVNNCEPLNKSNIGGSVTTSEKCPHCNQRHIFRLYEEREWYESDEILTTLYDCKCPSCNKIFDIKIEDEIND